MKNPELITVRFELRGRVQGVGCRAQVERRLNALGHELGEPVAGWVRNLPEGAVEVLVRAAPAVVDRIEGLLSGSLSYPVRVETLSRAPASEAEISEDFSVFRVLRD